MTEEKMRQKLEDAFAEIEYCIDSVQGALRHRQQPQDYHFHTALKACRDGRAALSQEGLVAPSRCCGKPVLVWTGNPPEPSHEECCGNFVPEQEGLVAGADDKVDRLIRRAKELKL